MRFVLLLLCAFVGALAGSGGAFAHAGLISTDPVEGAILPEAPPGIGLVFTEPVAPIRIVLVGVGGTPVTLEARADGPRLAVTLPAELDPGSYLLSWRVTSEDGHPVGGTLGFAIGARSGEVAAPPADLVLATVILVVRAGQYAALLFGIGSLAFGALVPLPGAVVRLARWLAALGLILVPIAIGLQGLDLASQPFAALLTPEPWRAALATSYGATEGLFALAFAVALVPHRAAGVLAALLGAAAPALSGHASTADPQWLMRSAVLVHLASLLFWIGALLPLAALLRAGEYEGLRRFSRIIPLPIAALLVSGLVLAGVQLGLPRPEWISGYGALLAVKLVLVLLLLVVALWNRLRLTAPALAGQAMPLMRSLAIEMVLALVILGVVAGWRFTPPPRVLVAIEAASAPAVAVLNAPGMSGMLTVSPGRPGPVAMALELSGDAQAVTLELAQPEAGIAAISREATPDSPGHWRVDGVVLPLGGIWSVNVKARTGDFDLTTLAGSLVLADAGGAAPPALDSAPQACAAGRQFSVGPISVSGAYMRATPPGARAAGAYLTLRNAGTAANTLVGASSASAANVTLHSMTMNEGVMEMAPLEGGLVIPPGSRIALEPKGFHLMLTGFDAPFVEGSCAKMVLHFARGADLPIELSVGGFAQDGPPDGTAPATHDMHDMGAMEEMQQAAPLP